MTTGLSRGELLRRGAMGGGALLASASGFSGLAARASAATPPDLDLAYLRLLIATELLALDFQTQALASGKLRHKGASALFRRMRADERSHYALLAELITGAGQTPATAGDIDFAYPERSFRGQTSIVRLAAQVERLSLGAYLGAVEHVETQAFRLPLGQIVASEAQHAGAVAALEGLPVLGKALPPKLPMAAASNALGRFES